MSTPDDRKLLSLLDSLSPAHVERLKTLADARTAVPPEPPTDGPETYRGTPVPVVLRPNWDQPEASWWRAGVLNALGVAAPLLLALADTKACEFDSSGACLTHDYPPPLCADGEARKLIAATKEGDAT